MLCVRPQQTFQNGGDDGGEQAAGIDGDIEDGEESASLLFLHREKAEINMTGVDVIFMRCQIIDEAFRPLTQALNRHTDLWLLVIKLLGGIKQRYREC